MDPVIYSVLHVIAGFVLVAFTFSAFANPRPERRGFVMMITGVASLVMVVAGFGLQAKLHLGFPGWLIAKIVCWLALSAMAGIAFRRPGLASIFSLVATALVAAAVFCVYMRPF